MKQSELNEIIRLHKLWLINKTEGIQADLRGADLFGADLSHVDLTHADLRGADLRETDLTHADLFGADLSHVDLTHANLTHANLTHADLTKAKGIITFQNGNDLIIAFNDMIGIGDKHHKISYWSTHYKTLCAECDYSDSEIELYSMFIKMISKNLNKLKGMKNELRK